MEHKTPTVNFDAHTEQLTLAHKEGRDFLYEYEVYNFLTHLGAETPPKCNLLPRGVQCSDEEILSLPGEKAVLKIVSPTIIHKTEVGGVRVVDKDPNKVRSAARRMQYEVPENYALWIERNMEAAPKAYRGLEGESLVAAISNDIKGVLQVQFMPPDSEAFGNELIVGLRRTREFGTVISAGLGGTDAELYAERFRKGQAIVAASVEMTDGQKFFELFKKTISYRKLAGLTRGQRRIVTDEQIIECFSAFISTGRHFAPTNPDAPFIIDELEINPFAFTDYLMVPLDGMLRFSLPEPQEAGRPVRKIKNMVQPERIGIVGVSASRQNYGRTMLQNILAQGFPREKVVVIREGVDEIDGVRCVPDLASLDKKLDLFVVSIGAAQVPDLVDEVISRDAAQSVLLIPGGMGETAESRERAARVIARVKEAHATEEGGPIFLGANSMGVVSYPGRYDTWFVPEEKLPKDRSGNHKRAALISQSGAFMVNRTTQCPQLQPGYLISMGNQTDLTLGDMVNYFADADDVDVIAVYAEGFNNLDGLAFCRGVRRAVLAGKDVVFYKAGRTPEGKSATSGHTASLAGDYMVCETCVRQAGASIARSFVEFQDLFLLAECLHGKSIRGNRLGVVSGSGYEAVGMADSIHSDDYRLNMASLSEQSKAAILEVLQSKRLDSLVTLTNPLDINPGSDDDAHVKIADIVVSDCGVDALILGLDPISPAVHTLADTTSAYHMDNENGYTTLLPALVARCDKPILAVADGGGLYDPLRNELREKGVPVFTSGDRAVAALALYLESRIARRAIQGTHDLVDMSFCRES